MQSKIENRESKILDVDWEVLPPEERRRRQGLEPLFKWLALIMDEVIRVPGTKFRFGLDPLLGLIPGLGDTSSALVSAFALIQAARLGVPKILLARMSVNILLNEVIGVVPIVGDAFSFWFKSNARNHKIIKEHTRHWRCRASGAIGFLSSRCWLFLSWSSVSAWSSASSSSRRWPISSPAVVVESSVAASLCEA